MNQYSKLNRSNVLIKMRRRNNPVTSISQMAREFSLPRTSARRELKRLLSGTEFAQLSQIKNTRLDYVGS